MYTHLLGSIDVSRFWTRQEVPVGQGPGYVCPFMVADGSLWSHAHIHVCGSHVYPQEDRTVEPVQSTQRSKNECCRKKNKRESKKRYIPWRLHIPRQQDRYLA